MTVGFFATLRMTAKNTPCAEDSAQGVLVK